jgi:hypothetical protein
LIWLGEEICLKTLSSEIKSQGPRFEWENTGKILLSYINQGEKQGISISGR